MTYEEQQAALQCLREARAWVERAYDEADAAHSASGDDYMNSNLFETMKEASDLMYRIDAIVGPMKPTGD